MIRLGLRLTLAAGREALARLLLVVIAVAIGAGLLLATLATYNAVNAQNDRYAWLESPLEVDRSSGIAPLWWRVNADYFRGELVGRVDVAATGANSPVPPGVPRLPGAGEFYASPAMTVLLHDHPSAQLADRYPGSQIGIIGAAALPAPDTLLVLIGHRASDASEAAGYDQITSISTRSPGECVGDCLPGVGIDRNGITLILSVVAAALLFPVLIFIGGATRLSAARREQRFAAMRLVGATPRQVAVVATVESALGAGIGVVLGFGVFFLLRPGLASIPFTGSVFYLSDISLTLADVLVVVLAVPLGAAVVARLTLRRVAISPLGVQRRVALPPPRAWRALPLLVGLGWLWYLAYDSDIGSSHHHTSTEQSLAYLGGILLVMAGLVVAGPWVTRQGSRLIARRARRAASLIASRRLGDSPQSSFRAVSGLVLALFVGTCATAIITTIDAYTGSATDATTTERGTVVSSVAAGPQLTTRKVTAIPAATARALAASPGVHGVAVIHRSGGVMPDQPPPHYFVDCAQLAGVPAFGRCAPGAAVVEIDPQYGGSYLDHSTMTGTVWPVSDVTVAGLAALPIDTIAVGTDGTSGAVERARTLLGLAFPRTFAPETLAEMASSHRSEIDSYQRLADVVIITSLPIAGCSLAVGIAGGLAERRRPFGLLRLAGAPLSILRRVVLIEAAGPLLAAAVIAVGAGLLSAHLFLRAQLHETLHTPPLGYYLLVLAGLGASLAVIASTLPLLRRATATDAVRND